MIYQADKEFIERCLNSYASKMQLIHVAKKPPFDVRDGGVPPEMFDSDVDAEGWVKWKMLPSTLTENDVVEIEKMLPEQFPPLFRAFLTTRFTMDIETPEARLPALPSDNPLGNLLLQLRGWSALLPSGYVAFAEDGNDTGPLCFDFNNRLADGDCPIVVFDHEHLANLGEELCGEREQVLSYAKPAYASFRELLEKACL